MSALRGPYRLLVRRLPPRAAWAVWRAALALTPARRRRVPGPEVALARVATGVDEAGLVQVVGELVAAGGERPSRLLVVTDCDAVHVAAARGVRLEHLPPGPDFERRGPGAYDGFLEHRGRAIRAAYRIARVEVVGEAPEALRRGLGA